MLISVKELHGYAARAADGDIGGVDSFFFDENRWAVRYAVIETGNWLLKRQVLVSPHAIQSFDRDAQLLNLGLNKEQLERSPEVSLDEPVTREQEIGLHKHYGWPAYWEAEMDILEGDPRLHSTREVMGYTIRAKDGDIGHLEDFLMDDADWIVRYLVIDTRDWLPGKKVIIAPSWAENVDWYEQALVINLHKETIENSPEYDPSRLVDRTYEERLYEYYGRPRYWDE